LSEHFRTSNQRRRYAWTGEGEFYADDEEGKDSGCPLSQVTVTGPVRSSDHGVALKEFARAP